MAAVVTNRCQYERGAGFRNFDKLRDESDGTVPAKLRKGTPPDLSDFAGGRLQVELSTVIYTIVSRVHHRSSVIYSYLHIVSRVHHP